MGSQRRRLAGACLGGRSVYDGYIIEDIYCTPGNEYISFTSKPEIVRLNESIGQVDDDQYKRLQIRKTVETHLDKELLLRPQRDQGTEPVLHRPGRELSLLRRARATPNRASMRRCLRRSTRAEIRKPKYDSLFGEIERETAVEGIHDGYFAVDKKKVAGQDRQHV